MSVQVSIHLEPGDEPRGSINPGGSSQRPFGVVYLDSSYAYLSLGQLTDDQAVAYLDTLADAASGLAAKIRLAQAAAQVQPETVAGA